MKKAIIVINAILILAVLAGDVLYLQNHELLTKSLTSAGFVVLGLVNVIYALYFGAQNKKFCITMVVGLVLGMLGDIVLNIHFIGGAIIFALGHIAYFVAYCFVEKARVMDIIIAAIIFVPSVLFIVFAPIFTFDGVLMKMVCVVYAVIISCMLGKSIANLIKETNLLNMVLVVGSALFFISDLMLLLDIFASLPRITGILCLATYYPAQCLLAMSPLFVKRDK